MKNLVRIVPFCLLLAVGCAGHKETTTPGAMATINSKCVVSGQPLDPDAVQVDYMGGKVGLCCEKCLPKWNAMDEAGKKAAVDAAR
jgi:hypothetical protein